MTPLLKPNLFSLSNLLIVFSVLYLVYLGFLSTTSVPAIFHSVPSSEYNMNTILINNSSTHKLDHIYVERTQNVGYFGINVTFFDHDTSQNTSVITSLIKSLNSHLILQQQIEPITQSNTFVQKHKIIYYTIDLPRDVPEQIISKYKNYYNQTIRTTYFDKTESIYDVLSFGSLFPFIVLILFMKLLSFTSIGGSGVIKMTRDIDVHKVDKTVEIRFTDVVGLTEAKHQMQKYVDIMKNRQKYDEIGARIPKGVLLCGSPGCGKTLLAKAVAGEAGVSFLSICGSDFDEMFVGVGSQRVKQLFDLARASAPAIIFIDEIDSIGETRNQGSLKGKNTDTLNKILSEMDGFKNCDNIMVMGSTNRENTLDPALLRSGRFDSKIYIDPPTRKERTELFKLYVAKIKIDPVLNIDTLCDKLARMAPGMTGADVANACNQAAINAVAASSSVCREIDMIKAVDDVSIGIEKKSRQIQKQELEHTAYHEAGHALMGYILKDTMSPMKLSIIPRGHGIAGYTMPQESETGNKTREQFISEVYELLAGRGAEIVKFSVVSSGAGSDFEKATKIISDMITKHGMYHGYAPMVFDISRESPYCVSEIKRAEIEDLIQDELSHIFDEVLSILEKYKNNLDVLAQKLLVDEIIEYDQIKQLFPDLESSVCLKNTNNVKEL